MADRNERVERVGTKYNPQRHVPSVLVPVARLHLLSR
jgi:hypothetical protein